MSIEATATPPVPPEYTGKAFVEIWAKLGKEKSVPAQTAENNTYAYKTILGNFDNWEILDMRTIVMKDAKARLYRMTLSPATKMTLWRRFNNSVPWVLKKTEDPTLAWHLPRDIGGEPRKHTKVIKGAFEGAPKVESIDLAFPVEPGKMFHLVVPAGSIPMAESVGERVCAWIKSMVEPNK